MTQTAERYYEFLSREDALSREPIQRLPLTLEHRRILTEAHRLMAGFLAVVTVEHLGYDGKLKAGQLVVHEAVADSIRGQFAFMLDNGFAIEKVQPHVMYGYDDTRAMADNNTSCYRPDFVGDPNDGALSKHFAGVAVDIEPIHNKQRNPDGSIVPPYTADYTVRYDSVLLANLAIRQNFSNAGFEYGGTWPMNGIEVITGHRDFYPHAPADMHHFELRDARNPDESHLIDMRHLPLPTGIIYEHPGRIRAAWE